MNNSRLFSESLSILEDARETTAMPQVSSEDPYYESAPSLNVSLSSSNISFSTESISQRSPSSFLSPTKDVVSPSSTPSSDDL